MRVAVHGATGKVGREVVSLVEQAGDLAYAGAFGSRANPGELPECDVVIDFSAPQAAMELLGRLEGTALPLVVGTTGFTAEQASRLRDEGRTRPILISANFTLGFEAFRMAATDLASRLPQAAIAVIETYNAQKKPAASGTTQGLVANLSAIPPERDITTEIHRIGNTPGINTVCFDLGVASVDLTLTVESRAAYAAGALAAARWLAGRANGTYTSTDML
ncbi:MAG: dihydrodipicolinate reductase C-terminal domain-containing protein [Oricola sp.]